MSNSLYKANKVGLTFSDKTTYEDWEKKGDELKQFTRIFTESIQWWLGDWIIYGENKFPDKYSQALDAELYKLGTLRNVVYVCRNVPIEARNPGLSFNHHVAVAKLPKDKQIEMLAKAEEFRMSVRDFRKLVAGQGDEIGEPEEVILEHRFNDFVEKEMDNVVRLWHHDIKDAMKLVFISGYLEGSKR